MALIAHKLLNLKKHPRLIEKMGQRKVSTLLNISNDSILELIPHELNFMYFPVIFDDFECLSTLLDTSIVTLRNVSS